MTDTTSNLRDKHKDNIKIIKDFVAEQKPELDKQTQEYLNLINENTVSIANVLLQTNISMQKKLVTLLRQAQAWDKERTTSKKDEKKKSMNEKVNEHKEVLKPGDLAVYIHGYRNGHRNIGEEVPAGYSYYQDPLLKNDYFERYYDTIEPEKLLVNHLENGFMEYTITKRTYDGVRGGGNIGLSVILKNGYKMKGTGDLPRGYQQKYSFDSQKSVAQLMNGLMINLITNYGLFRENENVLTWKPYIKDEYIRNLVVGFKDLVTKILNEDESGFLQKDNG